MRLQNIASERARAGLTQDNLAEKIGVVGSTVRAWERGTQDPSTTSLRLMSSLFGCSVDWLLGITEERLPR